MNIEPDIDGLYNYQRFPHVIVPAWYYRTKGAEIEKWLSDNIGDEDDAWQVHWHRNDNNKFAFIFGTDTDAMAFKLMFSDFCE
jgi:hypothetical protein